MWLLVSMSILILGDFTYHLPSPFFIQASFQLGKSSWGRLDLKRDIRIYLVAPMPCCVGGKIKQTSKIPMSPITASWQVLPKRQSHYGVSIPTCVVKSCGTLFISQTTFFLPARINMINFQMVQVPIRLCHKHQMQRQHYWGSLEGKLPPCSGADGVLVATRNEVSQIHHRCIINLRLNHAIRSAPMDPSTCLGSVWGMIWEV